MKKLSSIVLTVMILHCNGRMALAAVWDSGCEGSIGNLRDEQQEVESAHNDFESAKTEMEFARSMYALCSPSLYDDCEFQRMNVNIAVQEYNNTLETLRSQLSDFEYALVRFKRECLS